MVVKKKTMRRRSVRNRNYRKSRKRNVRKSVRRNVQKSVKRNSKRNVRKSVRKSVRGEHVNTHTQCMTRVTYPLIRLIIV